MVFQAIKFVAEAHKGQYRKGTNVPYISHLVNVMKILCEIGCSEEVIVAGILHDVLEDTDISIEQVEKEFGQGVAELVRGASEPAAIRNGIDEKLSWRARKEHTLHFLAHEASCNQLLVTCADKLDNSINIKHDYETIGDEFWERFNAEKSEQKWYYSSIATVIERRGKEFGDPLNSLSIRLKNTVSEIFEH